MVNFPKIYYIVIDSLLYCEDLDMPACKLGRYWLALFKATNDSYGCQQELKPDSVPSPAP